MSTNFLKRAPFQIALVIGAVFSATALHAFAFSEPSSVPPAGDAAIPLNVSSVTQDKNGWLQSDSGFNGPMGLFGKVGIGTTNPQQALDVNGSINAAQSVYATAFYYSSDRSLKTNIQPITDISPLYTLMPVTFNWKSTGEPSMGLIAQDVQKVYPQLVATSSAGTLSVNYAGLIPLLLEAVQKQQTEITQLQAEVNALQSR